MRTVREHDSLVSERLVCVWRPSVEAVERPTVRLARLCPAMACSRRRRSSWRKVQCVLWIGAIERCVSCTHHCTLITAAAPAPSRIKSQLFHPRKKKYILQTGDGRSWNFRIYSSPSFVECIPTLHSSSHRSFAGTVKHYTNRRPHPRSIPITSRSYPLLPDRFRPHYPSADWVRR